MSIITTKKGTIWPWFNLLWTAALFASVQTQQMCYLNTNLELMKPYYLQECVNMFPDISNMTIDLSEGPCCSYLCNGKNSEGQDFYYSSEVNNYEPCYVVKGQEQGFLKGREYVCMNGFCQSKTDLQVCQESVDFQVAYFSPTSGCQIECSENNRQSYAEVYKPQGTPCDSTTIPGVTGTCNVKGDCVENRTYVEDPFQGRRDDKTMTQKSRVACGHRHSHSEILNTEFDYPDDNCSFRCIYGRENDDWEILFFKDKTICGKDKICMSGKCHSKVHISICKELKNGALKDIEVDDCKLTCLYDGEMSVKIHTYLPDGFPCKDMTGSCYEWGRCQIHMNNQKF